MTLPFLSSIEGGERQIDGQEGHWHAEVMSPGLVGAIPYFFRGYGLSLIIVDKGAILGPIAGLFAELLGLAGDYFKKGIIKR